MDRDRYKWFYDRIFSRFYNPFAKWCLLPLGGEARVRAAWTAPVAFARNESILDMCCGTGGATPIISQRAGDGSWIAGMDLSAGQIRVARRNSRLAHVQFLVGDAAHTPFRSKCFDKVFISHALHEMPRETRLSTLSEARRILKDDGTLIVLEVDVPPNPLLRVLLGFWALYWVPFNFETPTLKDMLKRPLTREVSEAGFREITKTSSYRGMFQTVQAAK